LPPMALAEVLPHATIATTAIAVTWVGLDRTSLKSLQKELNDHRHP